MIPVHQGEIACYVALTAKVALPVVVLLHGAARNSGVLAHWAARLADVANVVLVDLPGHGRSGASGAASVEAMAEILDEALRKILRGQRALLVGESLGGTVALAIAGRRHMADDGGGPIHAVFAADPPLTTGKLWQVQGTFRRFLTDDSQPFLARLAEAVFGMSAQGIVERVYYPLVGALDIPAVIATGDIPLHPARRVEGVACLVDAVDAFVLENLYPGKVELVHVPLCGHLLLTDAQDACDSIIRRLLAGISAGAAA